MTKPKAGIIISTTRQGRFGDRVAQWVHGIAAARADLSFEIVDLRDYPLPFFDGASPRVAPITAPEAVSWIKKMAELDGYIFVTAEYNRSISAVLKNALDHIYYEPAKKPAAFVGYGAVGGARAVEHLRLMAIELDMVALKNGVHIGREPLASMLQEGKSFDDFPYLAPMATKMIDEFAWFAKTLKSGRDAIQAAAA
jgi:NAD(P)H-dependent FMN reductase